MSNNCDDYYGLYTPDLIDSNFPCMSKEDQKYLVFELLIPYFTDLEFFEGLLENWVGEDPVVSEHIRAILSHLKEKEVDE